MTRSCVFNRNWPVKTEVKLLGRVLILYLAFVFLAMSTFYSLYIESYGIAALLGLNSLIAGYLLEHFSCDLRGDAYLNEAEPSAAAAFAA